ncbi:histidine kinase [Allokutzneria sp. NRRL B-24872]|uniref:sensor histidine kinase n=1 Tax=Allokutzneria sp. NRRL B-24872 TaxID=1137961 RepID=UPI001FEEE179|nr:histidine kinase [Allokutzneria sp. NRRL B-24872]
MTDDPLAGSSISTDDPLAGSSMSAALRRALAPLVSRFTFRSWIMLLPGGALLLSFVGLDAGIGTVVGGWFPWRPAQVVIMVLALVIPPVVTGFIPAVRMVEIVAVRALLGVPLPDYSAEDGRSWRTRWRTAAWFLLHMVGGGVVAVITLLAPTFGTALLIAPVVPAQRIEFAAQGVIEFSSGVQALWGVPLGLALFAASLYMIFWLGVLMRRLAPVLLGPSPEERIASLERRTEQLAERNRLARELHDSVGHALTVTTVQAGAARLVLDSDPEFVRAALLAIEEAGRTALEDLDHVLGLLREDRAAGTTPQRTLADIRSLLDKPRVNAELTGDLDRVRPAVSREAYRIVQECMTNALRHAGEVEVRVRIAVLERVLELEVANPARAAKASGRGGRGLIGMRERVTVLGGEFSAGADDGQWRVAVTLPMGDR